MSTLGQTAEDDRRAQGRGVDRRKAGLVLAALLVLTTVFQVAHVARYRKVSPVDELQHLDYLVRAPRGDLPGAGSLVLQESGRIETCARIDEGFDASLQTCAASDGDVDVSKLQEGGYNTAYIHPPTYYALDGTLARGIDAVVPGNQSLLTTGRLAGLVWLWAAVVFLWLLLAEVGAGLVIRSALVLVVVMAPTVLHAAATINPDGTSIAVGAAAVWLALRWERGRAPAWTLGLVGAVAAGTKVTNLLPLGLVAAYIAWPLVAARLSRSRTTVAVPVGSVAPDAPTAGDTGRDEPGRPAAQDLRHRVVALAWLLGAALAVAAVWAVGQRVLQVTSPSEVPMVQRFRATSFPTLEAIGSWRQVFSPLQGPYIPGFMRTTAIQFVADVVNLALIAGVIGGAIIGLPGSRERRLAGSTLTLLVLVAPALVVFNFVVQGIYVVIPPRYGIAVVPAMVAAAVPVAKRRFGSVAVVVLAIASVATVGWALVFPVGG